MTHTPIPFDVIPYWQHLGATHGRLEDAQEGPLFAQVIYSLSLSGSSACLDAYRAKYATFGGRHE